jgi:hypothetical protein
VSPALVIVCGINQSAPCLVANPDDGTTMIYLNLARGPPLCIQDSSLVVVACDDIAVLIMRIHDMTFMRFDRN